MHVSIIPDSYVDSFRIFIGKKMIDFFTAQEQFIHTINKGYKDLYNAFLDLYCMSHLL